MKIYNSSLSFEVIMRYKKLFSKSRINVLRSFAVHIHTDDRSRFS